MSNTYVQQHSSDIPEAVKQKIWETYGKLPLTFVPNAGQTHSSVRYYTQTSGYRIYFTPDKVVFVFGGNTPNNENRGLALSLQFLGANSSVMIEGQQKDTGKVNYFIGNDPTKWYTELPTYREVVYRELWPGIDLVFRGENGHLKYDFVVQPGANWKDIRLAYHGAEGLSLDEEGNLLISTSLGILTEQCPVSYQEIEGKRNSVKSRFVVKRHANGESEYGFEVGNEYHPAYPLVIDPKLVYSTYLGGSGSDSGVSIAVDACGNAYVTGETNSLDFPTKKPFQPDFGGGIFDAFVTKIGSKKKEKKTKKKKRKSGCEC